MVDKGFELLVKSGTKRFCYDGAVYTHKGDKITLENLVKEVKDFVVPDGVTDIKSCFFTSFHQPENITISASVTNIEEPFAEEIGHRYSTRGCDIKSITVDPDNPKYSSIDGVLFDKNKETLLIFPRKHDVKDYAIPSSVKTIAAYAMEGNHIEHLTIGPNLEVIPPHFLNDCIRLVSVGVDPENKKFSSLDGVLFDKKQTELIKYPSQRQVKAPRSFFDVLRNRNTYVSLEKYVMPDTVTTICSGAFQEVAHLKSVIGQNVENIKPEAFSRCEELQTAYVCQNAKHIESCAFYLCRLESLSIGSKAVLDDSALDFLFSLKEINVNKANPDFSSEDGVLYNKDKTTLIAYPASKPDRSYKMPNSVNAIVPGAMNDNRHLKTLSLSENLQDFDLKTFELKKLEHIIASTPAYYKILDAVSNGTAYIDEYDEDGRACPMFAIFENREPIPPEMIDEKFREKLDEGKSEFFFNGIEYFVEDDEVVLCNARFIRDEIVQIPSGVTAVAPYAFEDNKYVKQVILTDSVTCVDIAFSGYDGTVISGEDRDNVGTITANERDMNALPLEKQMKEAEARSCESTDKDDKVPQFASKGEDAFPGE